ncbi:MAG: hypothetical protein JO197_02170 [Acidobacteria bacterium]|nr:hypothetical protein [Acidobacteriota bacterium]MBV9476814.1 hypothetical protein [Acidobacteriota bacterium]
MTDNTVHEVSAWPLAGNDTNERFDDSSGEPLPTSYGEAEYRRGWTDGRLGVRAPQISAVYRHRAEQWCAAVRAATTHRVELAKADMHTAVERADRARGDAVRIEEGFIALERHRLDSPASFSWPLGVVYCVVAAILWIADLPLSLLAADGLEIKTNYAKLANLDSIRLDWRSMWEPLAFAIGIAALGLFFKFVADFFFKPALQHKLWMRIVSGVMVVGLITLVTWNLYYLAELRTGVKSLQEARRATATDTNGMAADVVGLTAKMQRDAGMSFVLLTLTLPIIGGICASVGWSRIQNINRYRVLRKSCRETRSAADELMAEARKTEALVKSAENEAAAAAQLDAGRVEAVAMSLYEQGFLRGVLVPETLHDGRRLHERIQVALKRRLGVAERHFSETAAPVQERTSS